jgi:hypothetical protein
MARFATRCKLAAMATMLATSALSIPASAAQSGPPFTIATDGPAASDFFPAGPYPLVARGESGDFVVVFFETHDSVNHSYARLYNADATAKGAAFEIGSSSLYQVGSVAMAPSGAFAIAWTEQTGAGAGSYRVKIQRYAEDGTAQGSPIDAGAAPTVFGRDRTVVSTAPLLAMDHAGDMTVAWSTKSDRYYSRRVYAESSKTYAAVYSADGTVLEGNTVVDSLPPRILGGNSGTCCNSNMLEGLAVDADGDIAMVFGMGRDDHGTTGQTGVKLFDARLGSKGALQTLAEVEQYAAVGMDAAGNYAIAWSVAADATAHVSRFAADGTPLGVIGPLGTGGTSAEIEMPTLSMAPSGAFVVTWGRAVPSSVSGFTSEEKHAQYFHADGSPNGAEFLIDANPAYLNVWNMATAVDAGGNLVSVWNAYVKDASGTTLSSEAIIGRLTAAP